MPHFFIKKENIFENEIVIQSNDDNYGHLVKSLRIKSGETVLFIDENEIEYNTIIDKIDKKHLSAKIISFEKSKRDLPYNLYLAQAPLRSEAQSVIIEKSTELGVRGIYPIYTDNCVQKKEVIRNKIVKWQTIMYEASKQCERANIPKCFPLSDIETLISDNFFNRVFAMCEKNTNSSLREYLSKNPVKERENILLIIGPEGGFSDREFELMKKSNLPMLSLGDLILKAETAVIVALGNIVYEFGK